MIEYTMVKLYDWVLYRGVMHSSIHWHETFLQNTVLSEKQKDGEQGI